MADFEVFACGCKRGRKTGLVLLCAMHSGAVIGPRCAHILSGNDGQCERCGAAAHVQTFRKRYTGRQAAFTAGLHADGGIEPEWVPEGIERLCAACLVRLSIEGGAP